MPIACRCFLVIELGRISPRRSCRFRLDVRPLSRCRLLALFRFSLPVPVTRSRFLTLLLVFCFGMTAPRPKNTEPSGLPKGSGVAREPVLRPGHCRDGRPGRAGGFAHFGANIAVIRLPSIDGA